ncbi:AraC family transcriptional regulator [Jiella sp. MQZ9-1]|uniref:AraC family transcriptional regulator n=1 Tax=Jiella flava TaxID=2816857 RepID=A0A939FXC4_9HYPH|nr:AraC family transcriptional regulator [Jiella flava]MBO0663728.1 AraC family transcriptional regulator [Jiella flava]MCD2472300.1 AraC family transcriptional regulator [Jiella flava]
MQIVSTIASGPTQALLATIARRGANPTSVMARVGLQSSQLRGDNRVVPLATFTTILEVAAAEQDKTTFGLELGRGFPVEELGPIATLFMSSNNFGDALEKFTRYFPCLQSRTRSALSISNGTARLAYSIGDTTVRFRTQDAIFTLALEYSMIRKLLRRDWQCCHVDFEHSPDEDLDTYRVHFSCPIRFRQRENAISFPASYLNEPIPHSDSFQHARIEQSLGDMMRGNQARLDLIAGLEAWITACLARSVAVDIECAASDFGMSLRTFQRKLEEQGINYLDIRNKVRCQIAKCMLAGTRLSVTGIAYSLGYSETSAFSRGFRHQVGMSPAAYRAVFGAVHSIPPQ